MILTLSLLDRINFKRSIDSYTKVQFFYSNIIRNRLIQKNNNNFNHKNYLNIGCGSNINSKFINLDYNWLPGIDLCWDITTEIPLNPSCLLGIYTEHCLEHISYEQTKQAFSNFFDLLKPGGTLRVIVPDAEMYLDIYQQTKENNNANFPYGLSAHNIPKNEVTPMIAVNSIFRGHGHQFAYDYLTLKNMLQAQGFIKIKKETFCHGRDQHLLIDSQHRACESLYVEASKPES